MLKQAMTHVCITCGHEQSSTARCSQCLTINIMLIADVKTIFGDGWRSTFGTQCKIKHAAHLAHLAASRVLDMLDETADEAWVASARAAKQHALDLYQALVLETECV
jgi:hypothetical protein